MRAIILGARAMTHSRSKKETPRSASYLGLVIAMLAPIAAGVFDASEAASFDRTCRAQSRFALALHGGAVWGEAPHSSKETFLREQLLAGRTMLARGTRAIDVVESTVIAMEDSGLFNAGKGSVANRDGEIELDASIMEGRHLRAGAVAGVGRVRNPVAAARWIMDHTPHVMMVGPAADAIIEKNGQPVVTPDYFRFSGRNFSELVLPLDARPAIADASLPAALHPFAGVWAGVIEGRLTHALVVEDLRADGANVVVALGAEESIGLANAATIRTQARVSNGFLTVDEPAFRLAYRVLGPDVIEVFLRVADGGRLSGRLQRSPGLLARGGTVGAVALDRCGDLAAATSTGGFGSKLPGRVGDSPIIGAGTYADNRSVAVSATGHGEYFIRHAVAHEIAARVRHGGETLLQAAYRVLFKEIGAEGGVAAIDRNGVVVLLYNTDGMVRGWTTDRFAPSVATYPDQ